jgi:hypothetical protein
VLHQMTNDGMSLRRPRRRRPAADVPTSVPAPRGGVADEPDDIALVLGWLRRLRTPVDDAEELTVAVLRRAREGDPACLASANRRTRLQFLTVQAVLGRRGVV